MTLGEWIKASLWPWNSAAECQRVVAKAQERHDIANEQDTLSRLLDEKAMLVDRVAQRRAQALFLNDVQTSVRTEHSQ